MMNKVKGLVLVIGLACLSLIVMPVTNEAAVDTIFVEDHAHILKDKDVAYIRDMNEINFKKLEGTPQYAVVTVESLGHADSIEEYAAAKFKEMGLGQADLNNGFLFVIAIEDREYRLETGYGVEAVITDSMKDEIISDDVTDFLRDGEYAQAVRKVSEHINEIVEERYSTYGTSVAEVAVAKEAEAARNKKLGITAIVVTLFGTIGGSILIVVGRVKERNRRRHLITALSRFADQEVILPKAGLTLKVRSVWKTKTVCVNQSGTKLVEGLATRLAMNKHLDYTDAELQEELAVIYLRGSVHQYLEMHPDKTYPEADIYLGKSPDYADFLAEVVLPLFDSKKPLRGSALLSGNTANAFERYMEKNTLKHKVDLEISHNNQEVLRKVCLNYVTSAGVSFKDQTEEDLIVSLMVFELLADRDLTDDHLINAELTSIPALEDAYEMAKIKRKKIESGYRDQALTDLNYTMLGLYFANSSMSMGNYSSSGSFSGSSGGSSFGGGASGGGGFSGGW